MTPKEKAKYLIEKYKLQVPVEFGYMDINLAKNCALICIDEIIKSRPTEYMTWAYHETLQDKIDSAIDYLNEVKKEIDKL